MGMNGHTSVAPMRACAPLCFDISMTSAAVLIPRNAASETASGSPTNVTTVRFVSAPGSISRIVIPSTPEIASVMVLILAKSFPSLKLGTHSTSFIYPAWTICNK